MDSGFAPGELYDVGVALSTLDQMVELVCEFLEPQMPGVLGRRSSEARRARQIALLSDLEDEGAAVIDRAAAGAASGTCRLVCVPIEGGIRSE